MTGLLREAVAVAGGAGYGIGFAAGGDDDGGIVIELGETAHGRGVAYLDAQRLYALLERAGHVACYQRGGVNPLPLQRDGRHAELLEEADHIFIGKGPESLLEETLVGMDVRCKFFPGTQIGQVAAPLAGEIDLPAEPFVLVEQHHARPVAERHGGPDGCHHSRRSATDDGQAWLHHSK